jgi:hypothetical protein
VETTEVNVLKRTRRDSDGIDERSSKRPCGDDPTSTAAHPHDSEVRNPSQPPCHTTMSDGTDVQDSPLDYVFALPSGHPLQERSIRRAVDRIGSTERLCAVLAEDPLEFLQEVVRKGEQYEDDEKLKYVIERVRDVYVARVLRCLAAGLDYDGLLASQAFEFKTTGPQVKYIIEVKIQPKAVSEVAAALPPVQSAMETSAAQSSTSTKQVGSTPASTPDQTATRPLVATSAQHAASSQTSERGGNKEVQMKQEPAPQSRLGNRSNPCFGVP